MTIAQISTQTLLLSRPEDTLQEMSQIQIENIGNEELSPDIEEDYSGSVFRESRLALCYTLSTGMGHSGNTHTSDVMCTVLVVSVWGTSDAEMAVVSDAWMVNVPSEEGD